MSYSRQPTNNLPKPSNYNHYRQGKGRQPISIGIGLHTGGVMLGTIGEAERMESTVISDAVNMAARLESLTKLYGASIVISEHTLLGLDHRNRYNFRFLDKATVKGKKEPVAVFEIFDGCSHEIMNLKLETRLNFEQGVLHYHSREFAQATQNFNQVLEQDPADKATQLYLERMTHLKADGTPLPLNGLEALTKR